MVLDGNRFENCSVRRWFGADGTVTDGAGNPLTDEQMNKLYSTGATEPTQAQLEIHVSTVDELIAAMMRALDAAKRSELWRRGIGIPYVATWINQQRWTDEQEPPAGNVSDLDTGGYWADDPEGM